MRELRELDLGNNRIGDEGAQALAQSPNLRNLRVLQLHGPRNDLSEVGANALANSLYLHESIRRRWRDRA